MSKIKFEQFFTIYLGLFAFVFGVFPKLIPLLIVGLAIITIVGFKKKQLVWMWNLPAIALFIFYFVYLIGSYYTNNPDLAKMYAENKLSFIVFPLILSFRTKFDFSLKHPIVGLTLGVLLASLIGIINSSSCLCEHSLPWFEYCFTSSYISPIHHPTYFSIFILIAIAGLWYGYYQKWKYFNFVPIIWLTIFLLAMYLACKSLAGIIFLFLLFIFLFIRWLYYQKKWFILVSLILLVPFVFTIALSFYPPINREYQAAKEDFSLFMSGSDHFLSDKRQEDLTGNDVRIIMWKVTIDNIKETPFGVGTGNVDDYLGKTLREKGFEELAIKEYNPHNQYLQTTLEIGVQGMVVLLLIFISALIFSWKNKNWILFLLTLAFIFNSFFESMFQRESGIVFFSFWMCILLVYSNSKKIKSVIL